MYYTLENSIELEKGKRGGFGIRRSVLAFLFDVFFLVYIASKHIA